MAQTAQPKIAFGIARLHPDQTLSGQYSWGPEWSLPPNRTGRWAIDKIYNLAIRVEFDEATEIEIFGGREALTAAREALSAEDEKRQAEWLGWADKRESEAFVRRWNARRRREYDMPTVATGAYVREAWRSSGVWHIATGKLTDHWKNPDRLDVGTECPADITIDLGDLNGRTVAMTTDPAGNVCKRCLARVSVAVVAAPERQEALVTA